MEESGHEAHLTDPRRCYNKSVWCGNGAVPAQAKDGIIYTRQGTPMECLRKGVGVGLFEERKKGLPPGSLQLIKYVTAPQEQNLMNKQINTQQNLIEFASSKRSRKIRKVLTRALVTKGGELDKRAYNSVVLFLYMTRQIEELPDCVNI